MIKVKLFIISSDGCKLCKRAKKLINSAAVKAGVDLELRELSIDSENPTEAIDYAIEHNLSNVPAFKIGDKTFIDDEFSEKDLVSALISIKEKK
jgi:glutaredoxin